MTQQIGDRGDQRVAIGSQSRAREEILLQIDEQ
jgi:hypothetical protein